MNETIGVCICAAGGLAGAAFALPFRGIRNWKYESYWFVYALAGLVLMPLVLTTLTCPSLAQVLDAVHYHPIAA